MNNENLCVVILDLLPLYIDNLTSEETNAVIGNHLETCPACKKEYETLKTGEDCNNGNVKKGNKIKEIDFLKKLKMYQNIATLLGAVISFFLGICLPPAVSPISILIRGSIPDYYLARLQAAWHIMLFRMLFSGFFLCCSFLLIMFIIRKFSRRKV